MENFTLQKGPCNFLKLHTSPWESSISPSLLSLPLATFLFLSTADIFFSGSYPYPYPVLPLSSSSTRFGWDEAGAGRRQCRAAQVRGRTGARASQWRARRRLRSGSSACRRSARRLADGGSTRADIAGGGRQRCVARRARAGGSRRATPGASGAGWRAQVGRARASGGGPGWSEAGARMRSAGVRLAREWALGLLQAWSGRRRRYGRSGSGEHGGPSGGCGAWGGAERLGWREPERRVDVGRWRAGGHMRQCAACVSVWEQS
jgi:hypothetical protein